MAQHDYNIANQTGADFRADLNNALSAIATVNSGASEPSTTFAHQLWVDTSSNVLKIRNAANSAFITTGLSITADNTFTGDITGNAATATILATARTINGVSFNGSANISFGTDSVVEGSSNLYFTNERVDDRVDNLLVAGTGISLTYDDGLNTLTIANTNDADITGVIAGAALTGGGTSGDVTLNVAVDDSSIEINADALRIKASGITNAMLAGSIANSKLSNSSVTINSQSLALGGSLDLDTSEIPENTNLYYTQARFDTAFGNKTTTNLSEGSNLYYTSARANTDFDTRLATKDTANLTEGTNLYYTNARANSAIDARVTNTFINNLTGVVADTTTALATARTIALAGDVVGSVSFDGTSNVSITTAIQADSVALGTDTTGNYIQTITGTANKITVSGSGSETADVTLTLPDDVQIADSLTVAGNLTVNGTLVSLNSTNLDIQDNLFQLNAGLTGSPVNDTGMLINRGNLDNGIFMWDESVDKFTLGLTTADGSATGNITLSALGTLVANIEGNVTGTIQTAAQPNITSVGTLSALTVTGEITANGGIALGDSDKATFGAGDDLQIFHDGSNSYISEVGTGELVIQARDAVTIEDGTSGDNYIYMQRGNKVSLFYAGAEKLATTSTGIDVTGVITTDGLTTSADINFGDNDKAIFGAGSDLQIYHTGSSSYIEDVGTGGLIIRSDGASITHQVSGKNSIRSVANGEVELYHNNALKLETTSTGIDVTGNASFADNGRATFGASDDLQIYHEGSNSYISDFGTGTLNIQGSAAVYVQAAGTNAYMAAFSKGGPVQLYHNGTVKFGTTASGIDVSGTATMDGLALGDSDIATFGDSDNLQIYHDGSNSYIEDAGTGNLVIRGTSLILEDAGGNDYITMTDTGVGGTVEIKHNAVTKLSTTASGIDVSGTATMDGLTVDGRGSINQSMTNGSVSSFTNPHLALKSTDSVNTTGFVGMSFATSDTINYGFSLGSQRTSSGQGDLVVRNHFNSAQGTKKLSIADNGDISFYDDTGTSPALFWDASAESLGIGTDSPSDKLHVIGNTKIEQTSNVDAILRLNPNSGTIGSNYRWELVGCNSAGNYSFQIRQGATPYLTINNSVGGGAGNVGIGTTSPNRNLHVIGQIALEDAVSTSAALLISLDSSSNKIYSRTSNATISAHPLDFIQNSSVAMRIDSSGNLLVGKTSQAVETTGSEVGDGFIAAARNGTVGFFNRQSSDGEITRFSKDGTTVGSIGTQSGRLTIGDGDTGLRFADDFNNIQPFNVTTNVLRDNAIDLGSSAGRFKDLHLSGSLYHGGSRQFVRVATSSGGGGVFGSIANAPQTGFLYIYETGTTNYAIVACFKKDSASNVTTTLIANSSITVAATNPGGTVATAGYTTSGNVKMQSIIIRET